MLYTLTQQFHTQVHWFRVFQYLTFRSILAALTALFIALLLGPWMIRWLSRMQVGQVVRDDGPQTHLKKAASTLLLSFGALILYRPGHWAVI